jgi:hypothetical protein
MPEAQGNAGFPAGSDRALCVLPVERQRLLTENSFPGRRDRDDLIGMQSMRGGQDDGLHIRMCEHIGKIARQRETVLSCKVLCCIEPPHDAMRKAQPLALPLNRIDDVLSPPAEADDRCVDHGFTLNRLAGRRRDISHSIAWQPDNTSTLRRCFSIIWTLTSGFSIDVTDYNAALSDG